MPVACPSNRFADNRFAINIWVHKAKPAEHRSNDFSLSPFGERVGVRGAAAPVLPSEARFRIRHRDDSESSVRAARPPHPSPLPR